MLSLSGVILRVRLSSSYVQIEFTFSKSFSLRGKEPSLHWPIAPTRPALQKYQNFFTTSLTCPSHTAYGTYLFYGSQTIRFTFTFTGNMELEEKSKRSYPTFFEFYCPPNATLIFGIFDNFLLQKMLSFSMWVQK